MDSNKSGVDDPVFKTGNDYSIWLTITCSLNACVVQVFKFIRKAPIFLPDKFKLGFNYTLPLLIYLYLSLGASLFIKGAF